MRFVVDPDVETFARRGLEWLERDPVVNTLGATVARARLSGLAQGDTAPPLWITIEDDGGQIVGAALRTPPWPLVVPMISLAAARGLADFLHGRGDLADLPGLLGPVEPTTAFAARLAERSGAEVRIGGRSRLYLLGELEPPTGVAGELRPASAADYDLCVRWFWAFADEAGGDHPRLSRADIIARVDAGRIGLWAVDGSPVCVVGWSMPASGVVRIGPVYTPPEQRRRGYGTAATAAVSALNLAESHRVCLFTDLANPTSNSIYQRIGYRPVVDTVELVFAAPATA